MGVSSSSRAASRIVRRCVLLCALGACRDAPVTPKTKPVQAAPVTPVRAAPPGLRAYVANAQSGDVSIVDVQNDVEMRRVVVGGAPRDLRLSPDEKLLYVASDGVVVVDLETHRVLRRLEAEQPAAVDVSPDGALVLAAGSREADVLGTRDGARQSVLAVGRDPSAVAIRPDGALAYVTSAAEARVDVLDVVHRTRLAQIPVATEPRDLVFTPDGLKAFVASGGARVVQIIDGQRHLVTGDVRFPDAAGEPSGLALSPDGLQLFVATGPAGSVVAVDPSSREVTRTLARLGGRTGKLAVTPNGGKLYVTNAAADEVDVLQVATGKVLKRIAVGKGPAAVVVSRKAHADPPSVTAGGAPPQRSGAPEDALALQRDHAQWTSVARDYQNTRASELRDIDAKNVRTLKVAWTFSTGVLRGHEAAPLVIGSTMYLVTPFPNRLIALDLAHDPPGEVKWTYDPAPSTAAQGVACCDTVNRGAAYADGKIFFNTLDAHTVAVDAESGREVWKTRLGDIDKGETMTMAPLVVKGKVLVGNSGGELGVRGWLTALDARTGDVAWRAWSTGPDADVLIGPSFRPHYASDRGADLGVRTWPPDKWRIGGGTVWGFVSYDPALDLVYYGTGNPGPWNASQRPGDNKWACGVFARKPDTGEAIWFYQWSPHDLFDHDGVNENIVTDLTLDGTPRRVIVNAGRTGLVMVLDRATGEVLSADSFAYNTTSRGVDMKTGRLIPVAAKETGAGKTIRRICPASPGGKDWQPAAFSKTTGLLYIPGNNLCQDQHGYEANYLAGTPYLGANVRMYAGPGGHRGELIGWDVVGKRAAFRLKEDFPVWTGVVVTEGGVAFYGTMDGWFKAIDARSGELLWKHKLESGSIGQPITFRGPDGKQYVSIFSGVGGWSGATVAGDLDARDSSAALGFVGATGDLPAHSTKGGTLYTFGLP